MARAAKPNAAQRRWLLAMLALIAVLWVAPQAARAADDPPKPPVYVMINGERQLLTPELKNKLREERRAAAVAADAKIRFLEPADYNSSLAHDAWVLFFGEHGCSHCQRFSPKWLEVQDALATDLARHGLNMAKFECSSDLGRPICDPFHFDGYPNIVFFRNGRQVEEYLGDTEVAELAAYLETKKWALLAERTAGVAPAPPSLRPNGSVVELTPATFPQVLSPLPWFVKFYSPWCGHCQEFAPTWEALATQLAGQVFVGAVDCTAHGTICADHSVRAYPTLLFFAGAKGEPFSGPRKQPVLAEFALERVRVNMRAIMPHTLQAEIGDAALALVIAYQPLRCRDSDSQMLLHAVAAAAGGQQRILLVPDTDFKHVRTVLPNLGLPVTADEIASTPAAVLVVRDRLAGQELFPVAAMRELLEHQLALRDNPRLSELHAWVDAHRRPRVAELTPETAPDLLATRGYLALAVVRAAAERASVVAALEGAATQLVDGLGSAPGSVLLAHISAAAWDGYLRRVFSYDGASGVGPPLYIFAPSRERYWASSGPDGSQFRATSADAVVAAVTSVQQGAAGPGSSTEPPVQRWSRRIVAAVDALVAFLVRNGGYAAVSGLVALALLACCRRRLRSASAGLRRSSLGNSLLSAKSTAGHQGWAGRFDDAKIH